MKNNKPMFQIGDIVMMINADVMDGVAGTITRIEKGAVFNGGYMYYFGPHGCVGVNSNGTPRLKKIS